MWELTLFAAGLAAYMFMINLAFSVWDLPEALIARLKRGSSKRKIRDLGRRIETLEEELRELKSRR